MDTCSLPELVLRFRQLPAPGKKRVHQQLCAGALAAWRRFTAAGPISYVDSVVGLQHRLDPQLPADAFQLTFGDGSAGGDCVAVIERRYREPIVALHDGDLLLPGPVEFGYYAIYNAFLKHALGRPIDDWLIVNQALSVSEDERDWAPALRAALRQVG